MSAVLKRLATALISAALSPKVSAQEAPTLGFLYNTEETHSLEYHCDRPHSSQLNCEFVETAVRVKAKADKLPEMLEQARKQFHSEKPPTAQECGRYRDMVGMLEGKKAAPRPEALSTMSNLERSDALRIAKSFAEYCDKPTEENLLEIARNMYDKEHRTCKVSSNPYKQSFRLVRQAGNRAVWVVQGNPEGPCGMVQLSRFEPEETTSGAMEWRYIARKAITNPSGEIYPGAKCSGLDERAYTFDWRSKEYQISCDYIEFSPL